MTGKAQESATVYDYDENYSRTYLRDGEGNETTFAYDDNNQLVQVATGGQATTFQYDNVGNRTRKDLPNGAYTVYNYGDRNWLTSLENRKDDDSLISSYAYGHDNVGNRTSMTEANGDVTAYLYDDVYRLTSEEKRDSGQELLYRYQYTYDGVGNRLTMTNAGEVTYSYDANSKLTQLVGPSGTTTFGYDANGNMTGMNLPDETVWNYGYDYENRLVSVTDNADYTGAYTYSPDGLRLRVQESNNPNPDRWFQYDGVRPVAEGTLDGDTFTWTQRYQWEGSSYYDPLIFTDLPGVGRRHYLYDYPGSTRALLDADENMTDTYDYDAFGNVLELTGTNPNGYHYLGSLGVSGESASGILWAQRNYYMPSIGRTVKGGSPYAASPCTVIIPGFPGFEDPERDRSVGEELVLGDPEMYKKCMDRAERQLDKRLADCSKKYESCKQGCYCDIMAGLPEYAQPIGAGPYAVCVAGCWASCQACKAAAFGRFDGAGVYCMFRYGPGWSFIFIVGPQPIR